MELAAAKFKAICLQLMDHVAASGEEVVITKHGKPIAKLTAYEDKPKQPLFGAFKDTIVEYGDLISPIDEKWDVLNQ
jgi:prevent-host-death family protein